MNDFENNCDDCETCESDCEFMEDRATVTLTLDDGSTIECEILMVYPAGGKRYIALLPMVDGETQDDGDVYLYRYEEVDGNPSLSNIEDDDEYDIAADAFDEQMDALEYENIR